MHFWDSDVRDKAVELRKQGKSYPEIRLALNLPIPKATLFHWMRGIQLNQEACRIIKEKIASNLTSSRNIAHRVLRDRRVERLGAIEDRVSHLKNLLQNKDIAKIALATLYLGEGGKSKKSSLMFGNSNPEIITLFLKLLESCYKLDRTRFRCTVQCRADQNTVELEHFWRELTGIPKSQFYKARVDKRTMGKLSLKKDYKGVCRIDYFSADVYNELLIMGRLLSS